MTDFNPSHPETSVPPPPGAAVQIDLLGEAIRRGVQYLAFKSRPSGLVAEFQPGAAMTPALVRRAGLAAIGAHDELAPDGVSMWGSPARIAAARARASLARQLAEVRSGLVQSPKVALRGVYLAALAEVMIESVRLSGPTALEIWALPHEFD